MLHKNIMRQEDLIKECIGKIKCILEPKLTKPLNQKEVRALVRVPFEVIEDAFSNQEIIVVRTSVGMFRKYYRGPYRNFNPVSRLWGDVKGSMKCKFILSKNTKIDLVE